MMLRQVLFGEIHTFNPTKGMEHLEEGYLPEYSKHISESSNTKINLIFNEEVNVRGEDGEKYTMKIAPNGLNKEIKVLNIDEDKWEMDFNPILKRSILESQTNIIDLKSKYNSLQTKLYKVDEGTLIVREKEQKNDQVILLNLSNQIFNLEAEVTRNKIQSEHGLIYASSLFLSLANNSLGNSEGLRLKQLIRLTQNRVDNKYGSVDYDKALYLVLSPEIMDEVNIEVELYLKALYQEGKILSNGELIISLWDVYQEEIATSKNRANAELRVLNSYLVARKNNTILSEPALFIVPKNSMKATLKRINPNPYHFLFKPEKGEGDYQNNLVYDSRDLSNGFGVLFDMDFGVKNKNISLTPKMANYDHPSSAS